jgi:hypothetical protein
MFQGNYSGRGGLLLFLKISVLDKQLLIGHYRSKIKIALLKNNLISRFFVTFSPGHIGNGDPIDEQDQLSVIQP